MKRYILILITALLMGCGSIFAQSHRIYAVVVFDYKVGTIFVEGQTTVKNSWAVFDFKQNCLKDDEGNILKLTNFLTSLAYVKSKGWIVPDEEEQIYRNLNPSIFGDKNFLVYKEVTESEWLKWIENGKIKKE